ncbi:MAG TPA: ATP-binding protein [Candidatus Acidoferrales bacterium]|nr:ATP-binding protein [Candidatus Acidoferrales bacterium]
MFSTLRAKVAAGFTVLVIINVIVSVWSIYNFHELTSAVTTMIGQNYQNVIAAQSMLRSLEQDNSAQLLMLGGYSDAGYIQFHENQKNFFAAFQQAVSSNGLQRGAKILERIDSLYSKYSSDTDTLKDIIYRDRDRAALYYHYNNILPLLDKIKIECFQLLDINNSAMVQTVTKVTDTGDQATLAVLGALALAIVLSIVASWQFSHYITEPAEKLIDTVRKVGRGFLDVRADINSRDEIGELAHEFNKMAERLQKYEEINIEKLISEKKKSETIVSTISDPIIIVDIEGRLVLMNKLAEDLFYLLEEEVVGKQFQDVVKNSELAKYVDRSLHGENLNDIPPYFELKFEGENRYFRIKLNPTVASSGKISGAVLILQDVTQFKELDKVKSDFMARVSHEFRTPLTSINMTFDILKDEHIGHVNKKQRELLAAGKHDAERLTKLVRELLELSRIESGKIQLKEDRVETKSLIEFSVQPLLLQFTNKNVRLIINTDGAIPVFLADYQQLSWVISNLVTNALRFTDAGGTVIVDAAMNGDNLVVAVRDTGCGIEKDELEKIFDKFVQLQDSSNPSPGSVGLGLSIAKEIVELYDGRIWVESQIGIGTVFTFSIPIGKRIVGERKISA